MSYWLMATNRNRALQAIAAQHQRPTDLRRFEAANGLPHRHANFFIGVISQ